MRLVRGFQTNGTCKYALVRLDKMRKDGTFKSIQHFLDKYPELEKYVEFGQPGSKEEFFVFKFKDLASTAVLKKASEEYSRLGDQEFSNEILGLLDRTGENHPNCKQADTDPSSYILEDINNPTSIQTHTDICTNFGFSVDDNTHTPLVSEEACDGIVINVAVNDDLHINHPKVWVGSPLVTSEENFLMGDFLDNLKTTLKELVDDNILTEETGSIILKRYLINYWSIPLNYSKKPNFSIKPTDITDPVVNKKIDGKKLTISNTRVLAKLLFSISSLETHERLDGSTAGKLRDIYVRAYAPSATLMEEDLEREYKNTWVEENTSEDNWSCL